MAKQTLNYLKMYTKQLFHLAISASIKAGKEILKIYQNKNYSVTNKDNNTPLTEADIKSHTTISSMLSSTNIPILSEEGDEKLWKETRNNKLYWLIDPLDGTKEFVKRNGQFTVNIALMENNFPRFGVIYIPVYDQLYAGIIDTGAWLWNNASFKINDNFLEEGEKLPLEKERNNFVVLGSKSFRNSSTDEFFEKVKIKHKDFELKRVGSSIKFCEVASGNADLYPRLDNIMQWDVAAGIAILIASGGKIINLSDKNSNFFQNDNLTFEEFIASTKGVDISMYL